MGKISLAHKSADGKRVQTIEEHAAGVANLSASFASSFGFEEAGREMGLYHDVGKYSPLFQRRLDGCAEPYEHSTAGMDIFLKDFISTRNYLDLLISLAISGHHAGLPDFGNSTDTEADSTFWAKQKRFKPFEHEKWYTDIENPPSLSPLPVSFQCKIRPNDNFSFQFLGRMLFSCLVDADFLDTEAFMQAGDVHRNPGSTFDVLNGNFKHYMNRFASSTGELNDKRRQILDSCKSFASHDKGLFRLSVPTGGGKTLSSMAFALDHLKAHSMKRIIYVIPYVTIIKQTVSIFESIFGKENVLGHYSTAEFDEGNGDEILVQNQLATENWDKPIIVTTNVQFFESFFSNRPSSCRKLHNVAQSVIVFDEVQMLPREYLKCCIGVISELVCHYGCSAVLCTATQPALEDFFLKRNIGITDICPGSQRLFANLKRAQFVNLGVLSDDALEERVRNGESALVVLNLRQSVRMLYERLKGDGVFHLSTWMTPNHLESQIRLIRDRLRNGERCVVISTSLIEAGVDIDFPVVYRELTGLDSIIQAGGRCNRENKRNCENSFVYVFERETGKSRTEPNTEAYFAKMVFDHFPNDIASEEAVSEYFKMLYKHVAAFQNDTLDKEGILPLINGEEPSFPPLAYAEIARRFHIISKDEMAILIPTPENNDVCDALRYGHLNRSLARRFGKDCVGLYNDKYKVLEKAGVLSKDFEGIHILEDSSWYDPDCGLLFKETGDALFV